MTKARRDKASVNGATAMGRAVHAIGREHPIVIAAVGLALGAIVGSFLKSAPAQKQTPGAVPDTLKREANDLKHGASALALGATQDSENVPEGIGAEDSGRTMAENPLVINDGAR